MPLPLIHRYLDFCPNINWYRVNWALSCTLWGQVSISIVSFLSLESCGMSIWMYLAKPHPLFLANFAMLSPTESQLNTTTNQHVWRSEVQLTDFLLYLFPYLAIWGRTLGKENCNETYVHPLDCIQPRIVFAQPRGVVQWTTLSTCVGHTVTIVQLLGRSVPHLFLIWMLCNTNTSPIVPHCL